MNIICNADGYTAEEMGGKYVISNKLYDSKTISLLFTAFLEMFIPEPSTYKIPRTLLINKTDDDSVIVIDKDLNVKGTDNYEYVLIDSQFKKWKSTYLITYICTIMLSLAIFSLLLFIATGSGSAAILAIPAIVVLFFAIILSVRLFKDLRLANRLRKVTIFKPPQKRS